MKLGRGALILLGGIFCLGACAAAALWIAMAWSLTSWTPEGVQRQGREALAAHGRPTPAQLAAAERFARLELRLAPQNASTWCRLAYIQSLRAGRLDAASAQSLRRSYSFAPLEPEVFVWRTEFVFDNWDTAPADVKALALKEVRTFYNMWTHRPKIELMAARITSPSGKLALELVMIKAPPPAS